MWIVSHTHVVNKWSYNPKEFNYTVTSLIYVNGTQYQTAIMIFNLPVPTMDQDHYCNGALNSKMHMHVT